jgi:pyridoxamine 5'-phosphate oxidase
MDKIDPANLSQLRRDYSRGELVESQVDGDPVVQFGRWMEDAVKAQISQPNACLLSTATPSGVPSSRVVLLKSFTGGGDGGFVFCGNYTSRKGREMAANPNAALLFFWEPLERQVRIEGSVAKTSTEESERLLAERPREAQISAWASPQSQTIESRQSLEDRHKQIAARFGDRPISLPVFWGGWRLTPTLFEFWQGRSGRLHDRLLYSRGRGGAWQIMRLAP